MGNKKLLINYKKIFKIFLVLAVFLMSKTYYFGIQYRSTYQYVFLAIAWIAFIILNKKINLFKRIIPTSFSLILLMLINLLIYMFEMKQFQINSILGNIINIVIVDILILTISSKEFSNIYLKIIFIFCLISLPCFALAITNPKLAYNFCQPGYAWPQPAGFSPYYLWGINGGIQTRNCGPFWEPGAFQGFIIIGILILLFKKDEIIIKNKLLYFVVFIITLLTTQSATGYFLMILIILFQFKTIQKSILSEKLVKQFRFILIIISILIISFIFNSNIITNKLSIKNGKFETVSASVRSNDVKGGLKLVLEGNLFGLGETNHKNDLKEYYHVDKNDSVGLLAMIYTYGLFFGFIYIYSLFTGIKKFFKPNTQKDYCFLIFIFLVLHLTEGLWFLPVYMYITLYRENSTDNEVL